MLALVLRLLGWIIALGININYARRLMEAGVSCDLVVYPGACHGFQFIENSKISKRFRKDFMEALERGLG